MSNRIPEIGSIWEKVPGDLWLNGDSYDKVVVARITTAYQGNMYIVFTCLDGSISSVTVDSFYYLFREIQ